MGAAGGGLVERWVARVHLGSDENISYLYQTMRMSNGAGGPE